MSSLALCTQSSRSDKHTLDKMNCLSNAGQRLARETDVEFKNFGVLAGETDVKFKNLGVLAAETGVKF